MIRKIALVLSFFSLIFISGCKETLYSGLSEDDANEMLVTLLKRGVDASKVSAGKTGYAIEVEKQDLIRSLEIIEENSLPKAKFQSLGSVFSGQGMIASQTEEQARLAYAISQELADTFSKIDGVLESRVHVVLVSHEQSSGITTPPSAAVFLRYTRNSPVVDMIPGIKETVSKSVPGLNPDRVSVLTEFFEENIMAPTKVVIPWYLTTTGLSTLVLLSVTVLIAVLLGILYKLGFRISRNNKELVQKDKIQ